MKKIMLLLSLCIVLTITGCEEKFKYSKEGYPAEEGQCTKELVRIKGNRNDKGEWIYHMPGQQYYKATYAEECFAIEKDAQEAGYRKSKR